MISFLFNKKTVSGKRGAALFELLVYIAVIAIIVGVIASMFVLLSQGKSRSESEAEINSQVRFTTAKIASDIRRASSLTTPSATSTPTSSLVLITDEGTITYDVTANVVRRTKNAGTPEHITTAPLLVTAFSFTRLENPNGTFGKKSVSVRVEISGRHESDAPEKTMSATSATTVALRVRN